MQAEFIEFNSEWHKDCLKCKAPFGASSKDGLSTFFYRDKGRRDGFYDNCKNCCRAKELRPNRGSARVRKIHPEAYKARMVLNNAVFSYLETPAIEALAAHEADMQKILGET